MSCANLEIDGLISICDCINGGYIAQYEVMEVHLVMQAYLAEQEASTNNGVKYLPPPPSPPENYESEGSLFVYYIDGGSVIAEYEDGILVHRVMIALEDLQNGSLSQGAAKALFGAACICCPYYQPTEHYDWCPASEKNNPQSSL